MTRMRPKPISDDEWFSIRHAARRMDWPEVERRAEELGWPLLASHARRAGLEPDSLRAIVWALLLDQPDEPEPIAADA